jgi:hypothetical protein
MTLRISSYSGGCKRLSRSRNELEAVSSRDVTYNLLDGSLSSSPVNQEFESYDIPISLPTLATGDIINTTIHFTGGVLKISDTGPGQQMFSAIFNTNNSAAGVVGAVTQFLSSIRVATF